jgi:hypothetical protein
MRAAFSGVSFALAIALAAPHASADDDSSDPCTIGQPSPAVQLTAIEQNGGCAGFDVRDRAGKLIQSFRGQLGQGFLVGSSDGRRIIFLPSPPIGGLGPDGFVQHAGPAGTPLAGVAIFGDGQRMGTFGVNELLLRPRMVTLTVSHVLWVRRARMVPAARPRFVLETKSLRRVVFDLESATMLSAGDFREWQQCAMIAYGSVVKTSTGLQAEGLKFAKGVGPAVVALKKTASTPRPGTYTLCLQPRATATLMTAREIPDLMLNGLTTR